MRQEYAGEHVRQLDYDKQEGYFDVNVQPIGDRTWTSTFEPSGAPANADAPPFAPFYFGIKEGDQELFRPDNKQTKAALDKLRQNYTKLPYFMDYNNKNAVSGSPEFWVGANGTGAKAHADSHCQSTISIQLSGKRRWRLGVIPADVEASDDEQFGDGAVYERCGGRSEQSGKAGGGKGGEREGRGEREERGESCWKPQEVVEIHAGEAIVFPPGFIHETVNKGGSCAVSLTYQFEVPLPMAYFRNYLGRLMRAGDLRECR
jgi:hypothetical protein